MDTIARAYATDRQKLEHFGRLVHRVTGIQMPPSKHLMIESRLRKRLIALGMPDISAYLRHLFDENALDAELPEIIDLMTTNKTDFYREPAHFLILSETLVPDALARRPATGPVRFRLWSAAASTGAEAWTAAMVLADIAVRSPRLDWAILGTDISRRVLATARRAVYPEADVQRAPAPLVSRYVMAGRGEGSRLCRIVPELRARVRFAELNLIDPPYSVKTGLDVVFLRNVLIYFEPEMQDRVITKIATHLRPGGHLIVGHSVSMTVRSPGLREVAPGVFKWEGMPR